MAYESEFDGDEAFGICPQPWDEITDDEPDSGFPTLYNSWTEMGNGAMRMYDGSVYVQIGDGWVTLEDAVVSFNEAMSAFNTTMRMLGEQTHPTEEADGDVR